MYCHFNLFFMDYFDHPYYLQVFVLKFFTFYGVTYHMLQDEEGSAWMFDRAAEWMKRMRMDQDGSSSSKLDPLQQSMTMACFHSQRYLIEVLGQRGKAGFIFVQHLRGFIGQLCHLEICI